MAEKQVRLAQAGKRRPRETLIMSTKKPKYSDIPYDIWDYSSACLLEKSNFKIEKMRTGIRTYLESSELKFWYTVTITLRNWLDEKPRTYFATKKHTDITSSAVIISILQSKEHCVFESLCEELQSRFGGSMVNFALILKERSEKDNYTFLLGTSDETAIIPYQDKSFQLSEFSVDKVSTVPAKDVPHVILYFCKRDTEKNRAVVTNVLKFAELINRKFKDLTSSNLKIDYDDYAKDSKPIGTVVPQTIDSDSEIDY